ncbi:putative metal-binding motif-containing protein [Candidatus Woesearchaeota archaeon]|nr:putative metal-binding motif-containing protein [Candidatus Woesearchaeota archaeon]
MEKRVFVLLACLLLLLQFASATEHECEDVDGDAYVVSTGPGCSNPAGIDCNDNSPDVNPGVSESDAKCSNGIDDDCDGDIDDGDLECSGCEDQDFDGYMVAAVSGASCGASDCDDTNAFLSPGAVEICGDGIDNDCDGDTDEGCVQSGMAPDSDVCRITEKYWADCDGDAITTASEGDSVFLILHSEDCDTDSDVDYDIQEHNDGESPYQMGSSGVDYINVDGDAVYFAGSWLATWIDDGTPNDPDPEYYFDYSLVESSGSTYQGSSSTADPLVVLQCPDSDPNCGEECQLSGGFLVLNPPEQDNSFATTFPADECVPNWDCSGVGWSECDADTGLEYRDTSLCVFTGEGDLACQSASLSSLPTERTCSGSLRPPTGGSRDKLGGVRCGNLRCDSGEEESCPEDCVDNGGFPWGWIIFMGVLLLLLGVGVAFYLKLHKSSTGLAAKPGIGAKPVVVASVSPFTKASDLTAVVGYIKLAKQKGLPDQNIREMLLKSGWTTNQIEYAFKNLHSSENVGMQQK